MNTTRTTLLVLMIVIILTFSVLFEAFHMRMLQWGHKKWSIGVYTAYTRIIDEMMLVGVISVAFALGEKLFTCDWDPYVDGDEPSAPDFLLRIAGCKCVDPSPHPEHRLFNTFARLCDPDTDNSMHESDEGLTWLESIPYLLTTVSSAVQMRSAPYSSPPRNVSIAYETAFPEHHHHHVNPVCAAQGTPEKEPFISAHAMHGVHWMVFYAGLANLWGGALFLILVGQMIGHSVFPPRAWYKKPWSLLCRPCRKVRLVDRIMTRLYGREFGCSCKIT
jgi:hypothetical protein